MNMYKQILERNIPRLLNTINLDSFSDAYGNADREYWAWKIKDFSNGSALGAIHSLAIAYKLGIFPNKDLLLKIIDACIENIGKTATKKGSLEEAFPNEHSFCVTALVAFDALSAIHFLKDDLAEEDKKKYFTVISPLISFISKYDEEHAIISNHIATAVAAVVLWNHLTEDSNPRDKELLANIYKHQSPEGWYREYEGADPGYQTLCVYYLTAAFEISGDEKLKESLLKSFDYLHYFVHPDHSIGGLYGSRNTEVYYPAGLAFMASQSSMIAAIEAHLGLGIEKGMHVLPDAIDIGNFVPLLNAYARAAWYAEKTSEKASSEDHSFPYEQEFEKTFPDAGIFLKATKKYYSICNYKKVVLKVFDLEKNIHDHEYSGIFAKFSNGNKISTQSHNDEATFADHKLKADFYKLNEDYPGPYRFIILRMLSISIFRNIRLGITFKKMIVKKLMTGKKKANAKASISFNFGPEKIMINEEVISRKELIDLEHPQGSRAIHMASSGYNLAGNFIDDKKTKLVEIVTSNH